MIKRIVISILYIILAFVLPWWLVLLLGLGLLFYFKLYLEVILASIILDSLYGGIIVWDNFQFVITFFVLIVFIIVHNFKKQIFV